MANLDLIVLVADSDVAQLGAGSAVPLLLAASAVVVVHSECVAGIDVVVDLVAAAAVASETDEESPAVERDVELIADVDIVIALDHSHYLVHYSSILEVYYHFHSTHAQKKLRATDMATDNLDNSILTQLIMVM